MTNKPKTKATPKQEKDVLLRLRITPEAHQLLAKSSKSNDRSISGQARNLLHTALGLNPALH